MKVLKVVVIAIIVTIAMPFLIIPFVHGLLLKLTSYRWLINSIIYPFVFIRLKKRYKQLGKTSRGQEDLVGIWHYYNDSEFWFNKFWFNKKYSELLDNSILKYIAN